MADASFSTLSRRLRRQRLLRRLAQSVNGPRTYGHGRLQRCAIDSRARSSASAASSLLIEAAGCKMRFPDCREEIHFLTGVHSWACL